jgi:hypothetical protein
LRRNASVPPSARKRSVLLALTLLAPALVLAGLLAVFLSREQPPFVVPVDRFLFQGSLPGLGAGLVQVGVEADNVFLEWTAADGSSNRLMEGLAREGRFEFVDAEWRADERVTNGIVSCTLLASPRAMVGSVSNAATGQFREFELQPVATYAEFRQSSGLRIAGRGWRMTFATAAPIFDEPTALDRRVVDWIGELTPQRSSETLRTLCPSLPDQCRSLWSRRLSGDWREQVVWQVEHRSAELISLRVDTWMVQDLDVTESFTECHTFWIGDGEPERVELEALFLPESSWRDVLVLEIAAGLRAQGATWVDGDDGQLVFLIDWEESPLPVAMAPAGLIAYVDPHLTAGRAEERLRVFIPFTRLEPVLQRSRVVQILRKPVAKP